MIPGRLTLVIYLVVMFVWIPPPQSPHSLNHPKCYTSKVYRDTHEEECFIDKPNRNCPAILCSSWPRLRDLMR